VSFGGPEAVRLRQETETGYHPPLVSLFGRKVAVLPERGVLLASTDLQGNYGDYLALRAIYEREEREGNEPFLLLQGDLVHGPGGDYVDPDNWPEHLGTYYVDRSRELILDYARFATSARTVALLGNHEHAHIGGPVVSKFHMDEAEVLDAALGEDAPRIHDFFRSFPLLAVSRSGAVFTHGAPRATAKDLESFEQLRYDGYAEVSLGSMYLEGVVGALLWARSASAEHARALLDATKLGDRPQTFVAFGHDVVREGYERMGDEQICYSTSFGLDDVNKVYLRLDLSRRYESVNDLREGVEILHLHPGNGAG
jgi:hypothetical protein